MKTAAARALSFHPVTAVAVALLMAILLVSGPVLARAQDAPEWIDMSDFTAFGSGCSRNDTVASLSSDKMSVTIIFSKLRAFMPGTSEDKESFCEVGFRVQFPPGWSYTIGTTTARGFANLDDGVNATHHLNVRISGTGKRARAAYFLKGLYENNYQMGRSFDVVVHSACDDDRHLNIQNQVSVNGPTGKAGMITVDSVDHKFKVKYHLDWQKC